MLATITNQTLGFCCLTLESFDTHPDGIFEDTVQGLDGFEGFLHGLERGVIEHEDQRCGVAFEIFRLDDTGNADAAVAEDGGDLGKNAWGVGHGETHIVMTDGFLDWLAFPIETMRDETAAAGSEDEWRLLRGR
jgi:hypothetical protein